MMQTYEQVQFQIGAWSLANFGFQETPYLDVYGPGTIREGAARHPTDAPGKRFTPPLPGDARRAVVALDSLAPLMGIVEEVGELAGASSKADARDAVGDIAVYLCDYLCREKVVWPVRFELPDEEKIIPVFSGMLSNLGKLYHCTLKRHQRIRGMQDDEAFTVARMAALRGFVWHLEELAQDDLVDNNLLVLLNETWNNIIKKRDWKADAAEGGGHKHEG